MAKINAEGAALQGSGWVVSFASYDSNICYLSFNWMLLLYSFCLMFADLFTCFFMVVAGSRQRIQEACG